MSTTDAATPAPIDAPAVAPPSGAARPVSEDRPATTLGVGLIPGAVQRLQSAGNFAVIDDADRAAEADLVVLSSRMPRSELTGLVATFRATCECPVVVLVHTGGEPVAVDAMRAGANGVVAEGNEPALRAFLDGSAYDTSLLETYDRHLGQSRVRLEAEQGVDAITLLPGKAVFERRLEDLGQSGELPRLAYIRVLNLDDALRRLTPQACALLRRRLALQFRQATQAYGVELYTIGPSHFAIIGSALSPNQADQLGRRLAAVAETFSPTPSHALSAAVGHAGSEVTTEWSSLSEFAQRATDAATDNRTPVMGAETLALGVSSTTELETARRMLRFVEQHDGRGEGRAERVAANAAELAWFLGYEGVARTRIRLAALLHDIGKVGLPAAAIPGPDGLEGELAEAYRSHPLRGADYLRVSAGREVADAVRAHHERWDGQGFPDGLSRAEIPAAARIIATAAAYVTLLDGTAETAGLPPGDALAALEQQAGGALDPEMVDAAQQVFGAGVTDVA